MHEFIDNWPPPFRHLACITDPDIPDKLIVFAGERTWGDPPEGEGFKMLGRAGYLAIAAILGVWVEVAFFTITLPPIERQST